MLPKVNTLATGVNAVWAMTFEFQILSANQEDFTDRVTIFLSTKRISNTFPGAKERKKSEFIAKKIRTCTSDFESKGLTYWATTAWQLIFLHHIPSVDQKM